jgi:hypothetical protein
MPTAPLVSSRLARLRDHISSRNEIEKPSWPRKRMSRARRGCAGRTRACRSRGRPGRARRRGPRCAPRGRRRRGAGRTRASLPHREPLRHLDVWALEVHAVEHAVALARHGGAQNGDAAFGRLDEAEDHRDRRGLAGAVAAEQRRDRAGRKRKRDAGDRGRGLVALDQPVDRDGGWGTDGGAVYNMRRRALRPRPLPRLRGRGGSRLLMRAWLPPPRPPPQAGEGVQVQCKEGKCRD